MKILRALTLRDYIYIPVVLFLGFKVMFGGGGDDSIPGTVTHTVVDTVVVERLVTNIVKEATRGPSLIERISEREIRPTTVEVSPTEVSGDTLQGDTRPNWGINVVTKEGKSLTVSALSRDGGGQRNTFELPDSVESLEGLIPQVENLRLDLRWRGQSRWEPTDLEQVLRS
jgi:hypothetical protein